MPMTMSWLGTAMGLPCAGDRMLLVLSMSTRASACASQLSGRCTAIWSPSKSALNAAQTSGWIWMALPSTSSGSKAWIPRRCRVGARLSNTGCSVMTSSRMSQTSGTIDSTIFLAALMFWTILRLTRRLMMNGLKSSRAIILGRPHLKMHQCGLPKMMALELFKPFIMSRLVGRKMVQNIKAAKKMVESMVPEVWDILEEVITEHPVMLNRAPTLHRLGIQAFEPLLVEGKAIQIHPLVCAAFNADFDGDQMAVHLPLSWEAQAEARVLMLSTNNILSPAHGKPIAVPSQDMVIGMYYLTYHAEDDLSEAQPDHFGETLVAYSSYDEAQRAWEQRILDQREVPTKREAGIAEFTRRPIILRLPLGQRVVTTVGRALFNMRVEEGLHAILGPEYQGDYTYINYTMTKKGLASFINKLVALYGANKVARILDVFKEVGFHFATRAAVTISKNDIVVPKKEKAEILTSHEKMVEQLRDEYNNGFLSEEERRGKVQEIWREADVQITAATKANFKDLNPIYMMATSGARGDIKQIRQLAGWRGQMSNPKGEIVEQPVKSSFIEGLSVLEFFISTHGARKGLADTALRTADSGYLTRRLVDVCQDVTVSEVDYGTV